jgi:hypothetical protein
MGALREAGVKPLVSENAELLENDGSSPRPGLIPRSNERSLPNDGSGPVWTSRVAPGCAPIRPAWPVVNSPNGCPLRSSIRTRPSSTNTSELLRSMEIRKVVPLTTVEKWGVLTSKRRFGALCTSYRRLPASCRTRTPSCSDLGSVKRLGPDVVSLSPALAISRRLPSKVTTWPPGGILAPGRALCQKD